MKTTKSDRCLEELKRIIEIEGISGRDGVKARRVALESWLDDWVVGSSFSQPVIKPHLTVDEEDFIKYYIARCMVEELMEDCVDIEKEGSRINARILCLRIREQKV